MKNFLNIITFVLMLPIMVNALTLEEQTEKLNKIEDEITIAATDPDKYIEPRVYTKEDLFVDISSMTEEQINELIDEINSSEREYYYGALFNFYLKSINLNPDDYACSDYSNRNEFIIKADCDSESLSKTIKINYEEENSTIFNQAKNVLNDIEEEYTLYGMNTINAFYNYGSFGDSDYNNSKILLSFAEIKKVINLHPEFEYDIVLSRGGGGPDMQERYVYIGLYKEGYLYAYKEVVLRAHTIIFVDSNSAGTPIEKLHNKLIDYFDDNVSIEIDENETEDYSEMIGDFKIIYNDDNISSAYGVNVKIDNKDVRVTVAETSSEITDNAYLESSDDPTGVSVYTESYDVPVDSSLEILDVLSKEYVQKFLKDNNINMNSAFDINLFKGFTHENILNIAKGMDIYIPTNYGNVNDSVSIYYIKTDGTLGEKIIAKIIELKGKKYAKFKTNHLSTYGLGDVVVDSSDDSNLSEDNNIPQTSDNIFTYVLLTISSLTGLIYILYKNKLMFDN